ncbi:MAG: DUF3343 domain-containing protein [Armatimonadetes bacterium]|nr:DUF3343 domain-containing protein [Armatimonadota bacterium]
MKYVLITYERAHDAMDAMELLRSHGIEGPVLVPKPSSISARCGVALRMESQIAGRVLTTLMAGGLIGAVYCSDDRKHWQECSAEEAAAQAQGY